MSSHNIQDFTRFVWTLWGIAAASTVSLPYINVLLDVLPLHQRIELLAPKVATLATSFAFLAGYALAKTMSPSETLQAAFGSVCVAFLAGVICFLAENKSIGDTGGQLGLFFWVLGYVATFGATTFAFTSVMAVIYLTDEQT